jgi:hypothetical protein
MARRRRSEGLRERFGPEYERTMARAGDRRAAESELAAREHRRKEFTIVPLEPAALDRYQQEWRSTQARFVDDRRARTRDRDLLVTRVMQERGYPVDDDFERQRGGRVGRPPAGGRELPRRARRLRANEQGLASTDDLRQAFVHYRSLFSELLDFDRDDREEAHQ